MTRLKTNQEKSSQIQAKTNPEVIKLSHQVLRTISKDKSSRRVNDTINQDRSTSNIIKKLKEVKTSYREKVSRQFIKTIKMPHQNKS